MRQDRQTPLCVPVHMAGRNSRVPERSNEVMPSAMCARRCSLGLIGRSSARLAPAVCRHCRHTCADDSMLPLLPLQPQNQTSLQ